MLLGIDVSSYQKDVDWQQVYDSGRRFAFIKATEGISYTDAYLVHNRRGAAKAGFLLVGLYAFAHANGSPESEAQHFIATVGSPTANEVAVLDSEGPAVSPTWATRWAHLVRRTFPVVILYCNTSDFAGTYDNRLPEGFDHWWAAQYSTRPPSVPYTFWQYTDHASVPGVHTGTCDDSRFEGSEQDLADLIGADMPLTDAEIERIAQRTADLVKGAVPALVDEQLNEHGLAKSPETYPAKWFNDLVARLKP